MSTVYIPSSSLYKHPQVVAQLAAMPGVVNRHGLGYPDSVAGMWIDKNTPAHSLAVLLELEVK